MLQLLSFALSLIVNVLLLVPTNAHACHDENDSRIVDHSSIKLRVEITGIRHYEFAASCSTDTNRQHPKHNRLVFTSSSTWDPATNQAIDNVNGNAGWQVSSAWSCTTDPWLIYTSLNVACTLSSYNLVGSRRQLREVTAHSARFRPQQIIYLSS
jgi:hypothetical protein